MDATAPLALQLRAIIDDPGRGSRLAEELRRIAAQLAISVPSLLMVSIVLPRFGAEISVSTLLPHDDSAPVRASAAVPLSAGEPGGMLVLRAGAAGAFLLLADDLTRWLGPDHPPVVDRHLSPPAAVTDEVLAASLADLAAVNRGIGVLLDRGWPPEAARRELQRRAGDAGETVAAAARRLLRSLTPDAGRDGG